VRQRVELLELARVLGNVARACEIMGVSRDTYYRLRRQHANGGEAALAPISRERPLLPNRVAPAIERAVVDHALAHPTHGQARIAEALAAQGVAVSPAGVRGILLRHDLQTRQLRRRALAAPRSPGQLGVQDALALGPAGSLGELWQHTFLDTASGLLFAIVRPSRGPEAAAALLTERVLPFLEGRGLTLRHVLTDRSPQFNGRAGADAHPWRALIASRGIAQALAARADPGSAARLERLQRLMLHDFWRATIRRRAWDNLADLQAELDAWVAAYNGQRPADGWWCFGRTPLETFEAMRQSPDRAPGALPECPPASSSIPRPTRPPAPG
jgi:transposase-like protein